jgi:hypothetical protein
VKERRKEVRGKGGVSCKREKREWTGSQILHSSWGRRGGEFSRKREALSSGHINKT